MEGRSFAGHTRDISLGGLGVDLHWPADVARPDRVMMEYVNERDGIHATVPATVLALDERSMRLQWERRDLEDESQIVDMVFGRNDAWANWADFKDDRPLNSIYQVIKSIGGLLAPPYLWSLPSKGQEESSESVHKEETLEKKSLVIPPVPHRLGTGIIMLLVGAMLAAIPARAQMPPGYSHTGVSHLTPLGDTNSGDIPPATDTLDQKLADRVADAEITRTIAFRDLSRFPGPLTLRGYSPLQGLDVIVPANRVVTHARAVPFPAPFRPPCCRKPAAVTVTLNEQYIGTIQRRSRPTRSFGPLDIQHIDPLYFTGRQQAQFPFCGRIPA
ncbi:PilZ domain-containing protein [Komagataeibacter rhaeticus]